MEHFRPKHTNPSFNNVPNPHWLEAVFNAKASRRGGILRRAIRDVHREVGRDAFISEVRLRGWHLIESGDQYIILCNQGDVRILC
jgi:hypothetical protein